MCHEAKATNQPFFGSFGLGVAEGVGERPNTAFYFTKDAFSGVSISVFLVPESETGTAKSSLEMLCAINEKQAIVYMRLVHE